MLGRRIKAKFGNLHSRLKPAAVAAIPANRLLTRFNGEIRFFKGMLNGPRHVGALLPTSSVMAKRMASVIDPKSGLPVLELGPGTGAITKAILERITPDRLVSVEYSQEFHAHLQEAFPGVQFINGDAFDLKATLGHLHQQKFDCVISAIPLLNFPMSERVALLESLLDLLPPGRPVVQFSYGALSPIEPRPHSYQVRHYDFVLRNVPPAQIWIYRRHVN